MKKIRIGNDFTLNWEITRGGQPEDLANVLEAKLTVTVLGKKQEVPFTTDGNVVHIEFTPDICNIVGAYNLQLYYILPDTTLSDDDRKCTIDIDAFQIVPKTAMADDSSEFSVTSDMAIAFQGKSAYSIWRETHEGNEEDYLAWLQQPATDAAEIAEEAAELANQKAIEANNAAQAANEAAQNANSQAALANEKAILANEAAQAANKAAVLANEKAGNADSATTAANEAATLANTKAEEARKAASLANEKAELANTKAIDANNAAQSANEAAGLANEARLNIQTDLAKKAEHGYTANPKTLKQVDDAGIQLTTDINSDEEVIATDLNALSERLNALETAFRNMTLTKVQTDTLDVLVNLNFQGRPLFVIGTTAPGTPPDGVPQFYINTTNGDLYSAQNSNSVSDWKLK